jgi:hypothetical protein
VFGQVAEGAAEKALSVVVFFFGSILFAWTVPAAMRRAHVRQIFCLGSEFSRRPLNPARRRLVTKLHPDKREAEARALYEKAAKQGRDALPKDDREAAKLFKLGADQGNPNGQSI